MGTPTVSAEQRVKQIRYSYEGSPTLARFAKDDHNMRGLMGPFGSGKSSACAIEVVRRGLQQAPPDRTQPASPGNISRSRWAVVRNTFRQLESTTQKTFFDWFQPHFFGSWLASKHTYTIRAFAGYEIEVIFIALDRPEHTDNLLSLELTGAWVNEAREVPWELIRVLARRCNRYPSMRDGGASWWGVWCDTNPPPMQSEWYEYFEKTKPDNMRLYFPAPEVNADPDVPKIKVSTATNVCSTDAYTISVPSKDNRYIMAMTWSLTDEECDLLTEELAAARAERLAKQEETYEKLHAKFAGPWDNDAPIDLVPAEDVEE